MDLPGDARGLNSRYVVTFKQLREIIVTEIYNYKIMLSRITSVSQPISSLSVTRIYLHALIMFSFHEA